jgi:hypothetical protein
MLKGVVDEDDLKQTCSSLLVAAVAAERDATRQIMQYQLEHSKPFTTFQSSCSLVFPGTHGANTESLATASQASSSGSSSPVPTELSNSQALSSQGCDPMILSEDDSSDS